MTINYYIHPVNEYENTDWKVYENYMESGGYDDPVCSGEVCKGQPSGKVGTAKTGKNTETSQNIEKGQVTETGEKQDDYEYEIPVNDKIVLKYDILSSSPAETLLL